MPICDCGFTFVQARLKARRIESYAVVRDRDWLKLMRKERAILSECSSDKKLALIADAARSVGNLMRCPKCGTWLFLKPQRSQASPILRLKPTPSTKRGRCVRGQR